MCPAVHCPLHPPAHPSSSVSRLHEEGAERQCSNLRVWKPRLGVREPLSPASLFQFRENVQDVLPALPNPDDYFLLRWLRGEGRVEKFRTSGHREASGPNSYEFRSRRREGIEKRDPNPGPRCSPQLPLSRRQTRNSISSVSFHLHTARSFDLQKSEAMLRKVRPTSPGGLILMPPVPTSTSFEGAGSPPGALLSLPFSVHGVPEDHGH